jgi:hypothetical protein
MNFIGVDPGEMTGVVMWDEDAQKVEPILVAQYPNDRALQAISPFITDESVVACERYVITGAAAKRGRRPAKITIGIEEELGRLCIARRAKFILQTASDAKNFATDEQLQRIGWFEPGKRHAMDAGRHALLAIAKTSPKIFEMLISPPRHLRSV